MRIDNDTTFNDVAERMGDSADMLDGKIMLGLLSRDCVVDTDELSESQWQALLSESQQIRKSEYEDY